LNTNYLCFKGGDFAAAAREKAVVLMKEMSDLLIKI
jgi:hypothetical protein